MVTMGAKTRRLVSGASLKFGMAFHGIPRPLKRGNFLLLILILPACVQHSSSEVFFQSSVSQRGRTSVLVPYGSRLPKKPLLAFRESTFKMT